MAEDDDPRKPEKPLANFVLRIEVEINPGEVEAPIACQHLEQVGLDACTRITDYMRKHALWPDGTPKYKLSAAVSAMGPVRSIGGERTVLLPIIKIAKVP